MSRNRMIGSPHFINRLEQRCVSASGDFDHSALRTMAQQHTLSHLGNVCLSLPEMQRHGAERCGTMIDHACI